MKGTIFTRNNHGYPLFFQGSTFIDSGGNVASNNDQCNGIYDFDARSCKKFPALAPLRNTQVPVIVTNAPHIAAPTKSPSIMPTYNVSSFRHATCEQVNTRNKPCIPVHSWTDFRDTVEDASIMDGKTLIFCPFTITRDSRVPVVYITTSVEIICAAPRKCRLISNSQHLMINGFQGAQLYIQGFVFEGAVDSSVQFLKNADQNDDPTMHRLCNVEFIRYASIYDC